MKKPYVGITGASTPEEARFIGNEFYSNGFTPDSGHAGMVGVLVSYKTLNGPPGENTRYPPFSQVPEVLRAAGDGVLRMIHYNSREMETLSGQVLKVFDGIYDSGLCSSLQLNIAWPDKRQVNEMKKSLPELDIVLQLSEKAMEKKSPEEIAEKVNDYGDGIAYVLIDPSGGKGISFNAGSSLAVYRSIRKNSAELVLGFAGGLNGENAASRILELARGGAEGFSIDAEGGLRDKICPECDWLNYQKVRDYVRNSALALK